MTSVKDIISRQQKCLLVELAFAALNFNMPEQAKAIYSSLSLLIADEEDLTVCQILILVGLGLFDEAQELLILLPEIKQNVISPLMLN